MRAKPESVAAILVSKSVHKESDLLCDLFTRDYGRVKAIARGALRSKKRFGGALEPFHTLSCELAERPVFWELSGASLSQPRIVLLENLDRMEAASEILRWVRSTMPLQQPDELLFDTLESAMEHLDGLKVEDVTDGSRGIILQFAIELLEAIGFQLETTACVLCRKPRNSEKSAMLDVEKGGIVCRACGGARWTLRAEEIEMLEQKRGGDPKSVSKLLEIVESAIAIHTGKELR
ncbi:MAG: DNA repair protein RecO [Polyangiaceae bacterium]|nr:DNA repair protein RecO [Polyangiaceae bacterium]